MKWQKYFPLEVLLTVLKTWIICSFSLLISYFLLFLTIFRKKKPHEAQKPLNIPFDKKKKKKFKNIETDWEMLKQSLYDNFYRFQDIGIHLEVYHAA